MEGEGLHDVCLKEDDLHEVAMEREGESQDEYDVGSSNRFEQDVLSEDDLMDVSVHGDEVEDDFWKGNVKVEVSGPSGSSSRFQFVHD